MRRPGEYRCRRSNGPFEKKQPCDSVVSEDGANPGNRISTGAGRGRKGSLFPSVMIYMTVSSILMGLCGLAIHTMLRSDRIERQATLLLNSLRRAEDSLRRDKQFAPMTLISDSELTIETKNDPTQIRWTTERGVLHRTEFRNDAVQRRERFIFPAGTTIRFVSTAPQEILVRIEEPSPLAVYPVAGNGGLADGKPYPEIPDGAAPRPAIDIRLKQAESDFGGRP